MNPTAKHINHGNHLGSANVITTPTALPVQFMLHLPYGEEFVKQLNSMYDERFTFTGKEKDIETGYYYFGARFDNVDLGFMSVDPMSDKYPSISPYAYCAWNPIKLVDPEGKDLDIPNINQQTHKQSKEDILSLVKDINRNKVIVSDEGKISLKISEMSKESLSEDKGLLLLKDLVDSKKKFLYEASDEITCSVNTKGYPTHMDDNITGIVNASNNGVDSKRKHIYTPKFGYDGHVILALSGSWTDNNGNDARTSLLFHELAENYYRTDGGISYDDSFFNYGAHNLAIYREGTYYGNPNPGVLNKQQYYPNSKASYTYKGEKIW